MAENSKIEWTHHTFNPWIGCQKVHAGCTNCYAESFANRYGKAVWGPSGTRVKTSTNNWKLPLKWNKEADAAGERRRVFCASLADVFEDWQGPVLNHHGQYGIKQGDPQRYDWLNAPVGNLGYPTNAVTLDDLRRDLFALIDATPWLDWLLLTKRPENVRRMWCSHVNTDGLPPSCLHRSNVWLGTSVSDQQTFDRYAPALYQCRDLSPVLFFSMEPLLGSIKMQHPFDGQLARMWRGCFNLAIVGVESNGKRVGRLGAFESEKAWLDAADSVVEQCYEADMAAFVKQVPIDGRVSHDMSEWRESLRVREMPQLESRGVA